MKSTLCGTIYEANGYRLASAGLDDLSLDRTNPPDLAARLAGMAARLGGETVPIDCAFVAQGTSLGSSNVVRRAGGVGARDGLATARR